MLSVDKCRKILGPECALSNEEIEKLRDQMYSIADIAISHFTATSGGLPRPEADEAWEERAAIMEFDGKIKRHKAENHAKNNSK